MVKLSASYSFKTAEEALENIMAISQNKVTPAMKNFLTTSLPATKSSKKQKFLLGIADPNMGREIFEETGITATTNDSVRELMRGIRTHFVKIMKSEYKFSALVVIPPFFLLTVFFNTLNRNRRGRCEEGVAWSGP